MMLQKFDFKQYKSHYSTPIIGSFALEDKENGSLQWDYCREQFSAKFDYKNNKSKGFFFCHEVKKEASVANFLKKFEDVILYSHVNKFKNSSFAKTSHSSVLWIEPSDFWLDCPIKKSLLTLLVRSTINYSQDHDNFEESLFGEEFKENFHIRETKAAVIRFMLGFTHFVGNLPIPNVCIAKHGWHEEFKNSDKTEIKSVLRMPKFVEKPIKMPYLCG